MKILMLLSNPFVVDPRVHKEAKALVDAGHEVTVTVWDRQGEHQPEDMVDDIRLIRIHNTGVMQMLPGNLLRNPVWWRRAYRKGVELYRDGYTLDVVHCHDLDTLQAGVWLKKKLDVKLVYDAHEIFGYMIEETVPHIVCRAALWMEKRLLRHVDHMITVDEPFKKYFASISDVPATVVMNCKDLAYETYQPTDNDVFTLLYIGIMKHSRFFPEIIDLVGELDDVAFILAGKKEGLYHEMEARAERYDNVSFRGTIPSADILPLTRRADASFVLVEPSSRQHQMTVFNKQFEAMVCGRPILVTEGTHAAEMTEELECGLTVPYDANAIRNAVIMLRDNSGLRERLGRNAFQAARRRYNWSHEKAKLLGAYEEIA